MVSWNGLPRKNGRMFAKWWPESNRALTGLWQQFECFERQCWLWLLLMSFRQLPSLGSCIRGEEDEGVECGLMPSSPFFVIGTIGTRVPYSSKSIGTNTKHSFAAAIGDSWLRKRLICRAKINKTGGEVARKKFTTQTGALPPFSFVDSFMIFRTWPKHN